MTVGALVLAAGSGRRMGAAGKLTADFRGKPLVAHAVDAALAAGLPVLVVLGDRADAVRAALAGREIAFTHALDHAEGMAASLRAGIAAVPLEWDALLVVLGDMPLIRPATLAALASTQGIVIPLYDGRRGNPVRWPRAHFPALAALTGDTGARALLDRHSVNLVNVDDPGILADIDTPADLATHGDRP